VPFLATDRAPTLGGIIYLTLIAVCLLKWWLYIVVNCSASASAQTTSVSVTVSDFVVSVFVLPQCKFKILNTAAPFVQEKCPFFLFLCFVVLVVVYCMRAFLQDFAQWMVVWKIAASVSFVSYFNVVFLPLYIIHVLQSWYFGVSRNTWSQSHDYGHQSSSSSSSEFVCLIPVDVQWCRLHSSVFVVVLLRVHKSLSAPLLSILNLLSVLVVVWGFGLVVNLSRWGH